MFAIFKKKNPHISITFNPILEEVFSVYVVNSDEYKNTPWKDWRPWSKEDILNNINKCKAVWNKFEKQILLEMQNAFSLRFKKNFIGVHVITSNPRNISDPIIIRGTQQPEAFVLSLVHELAHEIISFNTLNIHKADVRKILRDIVDSSKEYSDSVIDHLLIYAVTEVILEKVIKNQSWTEYLNNSLQNSVKYRKSEYLLSYQCAEKIGFENILSLFREKISRRT